MTEIVFYGMKPVTDAEVLAEFPAGLLWVGRSWAVTERGLESLDGRISIDARHLRSGLDEGRSIIMQLGLQDEHLDAVDLATALLVACATHGYSLGGWEARRIRLDANGVETERRRVEAAVRNEVQRRASNAAAVARMEREAALKAERQRAREAKEEDRRRRAAEYHAAVTARRGDGG